MTELLIVPSPTLVPLSTVVPVPTDGQPERYICPDPLDPVYEPFTIDPDRGGVTCKRCEPVGPFPFTVGVWQEVSEWVRLQPTMGGPNYRCDPPPPTEHYAWEERTVGAVVATVEVTGKGHHADECFQWCHELGVSDGWHCHPDALPDGWHTPTVEVTVLDTPIPMERPAMKPSGYAAWGNVAAGPPQPAWWWADLTVKAGR